MEPLDDARLSFNGGRRLENQEKRWKEPLMWWVAPESKTVPTPPAPVASAATADLTAALEVEPVAGSFGGAAWREKLETGRLSVELSGGGRLASLRSVGHDNLQ